MSNSKVRKIIHIDMDAFYASVEQRDFPELRGKAIAVSNGNEKGRGVVATGSYEARKFGVRSAMSSAQAAKLCPHLIFVPPRFPVYKEVSQQVRQVFFNYTDLVEPLSLDEAYLDVTDPKQGPHSAILLAKAIKADIQDTTQLTASAGVASGKFLAKIASGLNKPDGLSAILPHQAEEFIAQLKIEDFFGIGKATATKMHNLGIFTGADLRQQSLEFLVENFGKVGWRYYDLARAIDDRPVNPNRETKSISAETTFTEDTTDLRYLEDKLRKLSTSVSQSLMNKNFFAKTVGIKLKYHDFVIKTRSQSQDPYQEAVDLYRIARHLLHKDPLENPLRLIGLVASNLIPVSEMKQQVEQLRLDFG